MTDLHRPVHSAKDERCLFDTVLNKRLDIARSLLDKYGSALANIKIMGTTPLISSVIEQNAGLVELLLEYGADIEAPDDAARTPLMWAASLGDEKIALILLEKGARLDAK